MYRLFIDYPISASSNEEAVSISSKIIEHLIGSDAANGHTKDLGIKQVNYRLGHDEDRQNRNYFIIDEAGHASTKKIRISLEPSEDLSV